ncbi:N-formylglutamate amidohydrolase [Stieleria sp. TO1_6]|uniref:N-formylglutamate amidohydrolase n=1 Tax=Stieleria tagensis TaxID=2956795 RepID=UPI00209B0B02|nr:N-formylglutamate amidohydrolase [Stieleria tagensis]MCO8121850.1 N-formylglutamate amidohydrolase [Stieleria tagensis]
MNRPAAGFVVSCEHAGNQVPAQFAAAFDSKQAAHWLNSHRGYDPGALAAATEFASALQVELIASKTTRLLVDLNRSVDNDQLLSQFSRRLPSDVRAEILAGFYHPYRQRVCDAVTSTISEFGRAIHLSIHTFTPRIRGQWRPIDIGLLFDPDRELERRFCEVWQRGMQRCHPRRRTVMNQPYAGTDDGFTLALRRQFRPQDYLGIEVEISNRYFKCNPGTQHQVVAALIQTLPSL